MDRMGWWILAHFVAMTWRGFQRHKQYAVAYMHGLPSEAILRSIEAALLAVFFNMLHLF